MTKTDCTKVWVITDGRAGNVQQARSLYKAIVAHHKKSGHKVFGREYSITLKKDYAVLPAMLWPIKSTWFLQRGIKSIHPNENIFKKPLPDIIIGAGRRSAPIIAALKRKTPSVYAIQLLDPQMQTSKFDVVIAPQHDQTTGLNVIQTLGALNMITPEILREHHVEALRKFGHLPEPRVGILLGGKSRSANFNADSIHNLGRRLQKVHQKIGTFSVMITPSRRTSPVFITKLQSYLKDIPFYIWNGEEENPYLSILACSDMLIVTEDSVNMTTEAASTGKPVYIAEAEARSDKIEAFHRGLYDLALTRPFLGNWEAWNPKPLFEAEAVAKAVLTKQQAHKDRYAQLEMA